MFNYIYCLPLKSIFTAIPLFLLLWAAFSALYSGQHAWQRFNFVLMIFFVGVILYGTLYRIGSERRELILMPFDSFRTAAIRPENYRSMLMNVFLFLPFGLTLSQSFRTDTKHRIGRSILAALALSVLIETMQYIFSIGVSEMDDVLCNTLGAFLGTCTIPLSSLLRRAQHNDDSHK